ncbi:MAG: hypothetical protein RMY36_029340 [Nostoc sp. SerVER01]|uniref:hypothetical protein n=1 Tax=Nostoc sp. CCY 9925 TaxID=3103865 RepID=UPI002ADCCCB1|nr:hypothetical protein [Nostoc sp. SerVER01]MDZ8081554.1 hypothetical protein [Nostoc sp. DcaGUA01]MDZ8242371.1 hypothetical protein [Nostoc sp. ChiQUE01a]
MSNLGKKRLEAGLAIATYSIGNGTASAAPTPGVELPKQIVLTASDVAMYTTIWKIYFHEDLSSKGILEMLAELGLVTLAATGTAYIVSKTTTAIACEIADWLGPVGWGIAAVIATSITGLFASTWAVYCDRLYSQREPQSI